VGKGQMYLETNTIINQMKNDLNTDIIEMNNVSLPEMDGELIPYYSIGVKNILPFWVEIKKID
jgi:arylsulfatase